MLQCTSEIEKAQPQYWPTLENNSKKMSAWNTSTSSAVSPIPGGAKPKASKMDKHFPNLLDTIEIEDEEVNNNNPLPTATSTAPVSPKPQAAYGPKGTAVAAPNKRASKKKQQQLLLFSTDMNFNRN